MPEHSSPEHIDPETEKAALSALSHEYPPDKLPRQVGMYFLVGAFNTAADFVALNIALYVLHVPLLFANTIGITTALVVGYFTNKKWVFRRSQPHTKRHFGYFVLITGFGLYGLQNGLIYLLGTYPLVQNATTNFLQSLYANVPIGVVHANVAKMLASIFSGIWNFIMYKKFVFLYH